MRRAVETLPALRERIPGLRMIAVAGPRINPATLPSLPGLEVRGYVHALYQELAACDVAVVQGGLSTGMELITAGRPFVSVPLARHFEQKLHVHHRLQRHGARVSLDYAEATPTALADAVIAALATPIEYRPVPSGGALSFHLIRHDNNIGTHTIRFDQQGDTLTVTGNYGQILSFVNGLDSFPRLFVIQDFTLAFGTTASTTASGGATTTAASSGAGSAPSSALPPLWIGGTQTLPSATPYSLAIVGSIYYTTTPNALDACTKATAQAAS